MASWHAATVRRNTLGALGPIRTAGLPLRRRLLYPLSYEGGWVDTARWLASNRPSSAAHDGSGSRTHGSDRGFGLLFGAWGWWGKTRAGNVWCAACPFWGPCLSYVRAATVGVFPPRVRHFVGISRSVKDVLRGMSHLGQLLAHPQGEGKTMFIAS